MDKFENFAENYYPKDISENEKKSDSKQHSFLSDSIFNLLGNNNLIKSLIAGNLPNFSQENNPLMQVVNSMMSSQKKSTSTPETKTLDDDIYEEY